MAEPPDRPGYSLNPGPPPEASRFLRGKGNLVGFSWKDVEPEEHAVSFTVAKAMKLDILEDIRSAVQKALDEGQTFESFQKGLRPTLEARGWWGKAWAVDPDGARLARIRGEAEIPGPQVVQLGSPRRLRVIYDSNLRSARAAGQWERIERTKRALPYLEYRLGPSEVHRPHHEAMAGTIRPVDDPMWDSWYPPNGWGCKCWVRQITAAEAERRGVSPPVEVPTRAWFNDRTGEVQRVPVGIDPGWQRNPGKLRLQNLEQLLEGKLASLPAPAVEAALHDMATSWRVARMMTTASAVGNVPVAMLPRGDQAAAGASGNIVGVSDITRRHVFEGKPDRRWTDLALLPGLRDARAVLLQQVENAHPRLIYHLDGDGGSADPYERQPLVVFIVVKAAGLFIDTMHRSDRRRWQRILRKPGIRQIR